MIEGEWKNKPILFPCRVGDFPFDIFSCIFYCLGGYLENGNRAKLDVHNRPHVSANWFYQKGYFQFPLLDWWVREFGIALEIHFGVSLKPDKEQSATWISTLDVDFGYKYKGKGIFRTLGASVKGILRGHLAAELERWKVLFLNKKDPWDVYQDFADFHEGLGIDHRVFILHGPRNKFDRALDWRSNPQKRLLSRLKQLGLHLGLHPGYIANASKKKLLAYKKHLESLVQGDIQSNRMHYLKFWYPESFIILDELGFKEDFSLGYADTPGFRWGSCHPSNFYDLRQERTTSLLLFPSAFMEASFQHYQQNIHEQEISTLWWKMVDAVKEYNGVFVSIIHENNFGRQKFLTELYQQSAETFKKVPSSQ
ncbi:MAG: DUF7033 domain-containing protein [Luteibaculum sp.]